MHTEPPEYQEHEEFVNRSAKLKEIKSLGINPYPHYYKPTAAARELIAQYADDPVGGSEDAKEGNTPTVSVAGRMILFRAMGKNAFGHLQDDFSRIQVMFNRDLTQVEGLPDSSELKPLKFLEKKLDLGDIIGVEGNLFRTQKGELTIFAKKVTLLCKTLLPLPDKHCGLADKGTRYRKRWLDMICHPDVALKLTLRSALVQFIRHYLEDQGFVEVETPVLHNIYGGAEARPFKTELNALKQEMFLRIALEISLKKLLVGGISRVFEIGKVFRNEGIDRTHNPEFTMLELYAAYWDYNVMMELMENMFEEMAIKFFGSTEITFRDNESGTETVVDLKTPWRRLSMKDSIKEYAGIDFDAKSDEEIREILTNKTEADPKAVAKATRGQLMALLFEELVEEHLIQPHHIIDHPIETTPLCKPHRDPKKRDEGLVERFETFIMAREMSNAYSELNDPVLQRKLLEDQAKALKDGNDEANPLDEEFIEAICQGMPPAGGLGIGIDRLVMLFTQAASIRDVIFFPLMRPESDG